MKQSKCIDLIATHIRTSSQYETESAIRKTFLQATNNVSWLKKGETVLLKPALNSPDPYPSTTHPLSIKVIGDILLEKGAKVIVGDQSGIEHVWQTPQGIKKGSSEMIYAKSGMKTEMSPPFIAFEKRGWKKGYRLFKSSATQSWKNGFYITNLIDEVDHIINIPRLSTHVQAGVTLGFKNLVGLLREDSRLEFHAGGPFSFFMDYRSHVMGTPYIHDAKNNFFGKIVEISEAISSKLRLTLFTVTKAQITFGPDKKTMGVLSSKQVVPSVPVVFASENILSAELFAIAYLTQIYQEHKSPETLLYRAFLKTNSQISELGFFPVADNPFIKHALALHIGKKQFHISYNDVPSAFQKRIHSLLL